MNHVEKKEFKQDLMKIIAKCLKNEVKDTVEGMWEDGPFNDEYENDEDSLFKQYGMIGESGELTYDNNHFYMETFSEILDEVGNALQECLAEVESGDYHYPHRIYEHGVCIAKFHPNGENEAYELWEQVRNSTDDMTAKFETVNNLGNKLVYHVMEDDDNG